MNRRERRAAARRLTAGVPVKGKAKQELRRNLANHMLVKDRELNEADDRRRFPQVWTPPANAAEKIRERIGL